MEKAKTTCRSLEVYFSLLTDFVSPLASLYILQRAGSWMKQVYLVYCQKIHFWGLFYCQNSAFDPINCAFISCIPKLWQLKTKTKTKPDKQKTPLCLQEKEHTQVCQTGSFRKNLFWSWPDDWMYYSINSNPYW